MKDDDPFNYPARSHERLLEIRNHLSRIVFLLEMLLAGLIGWFIVSFYRK
jgi:hypothetical protein